MKQAIVLDDLVKIFSVENIRVQALRGFSLQIEQGQFVAIMGPSGSGKTTLLNIVGGIDRPTAGSIRIQGIDITTFSERELDRFRLGHVGYVFQTLNLISSLSTKENIQLPMVAADLDQEICQSRMIELMELVGLEGRANHMPDQLSGGERQRVAIAMALANDPWLILADEPTGDLDSENAEIIVTYLRRCADELGKTVIMVTHDPAMARYADRICLIKDGQVASIHKPRNSRDAEEGTFDRHLRKRLEEIEIELQKLDSQLQERIVEGSSYAEEYRKLIIARGVLSDELHRLGH